MSLRELYQQVIIDHGRKPRNFSINENANHIKEGYNPLCGDKITIYLHTIDGIVDAVTFQGTGCAISMASASLMTETIKGKPLAEVEKLFQQFHELVTHHQSVAAENLGKLTVLSGVAEFPARVKCATLAWHTLLGAIKNNPNPISTETEGVQS